VVHYQGFSIVAFSINNNFKVYNEYIFSSHKEVFFYKG